jgi:hypothetical protein
MEAKSAASSGFSKPPVANPVMDVVSPPPNEDASEPKQAPEADPVDKLAADDQAEQATKKIEKQPATKPAAPKHTGDHPGVGLAIVATVIIVLGLAVLATYAYLQTTR